MVTFEVFVQRFNKLLPFLKEKAPEIALKHETEIIQLSNKQLLQGNNIWDKVMQTGYSPQYGKKRRKAGLQTQFVDLKFTGKYQKSKKLVVDAQENGIDIISDVDYEGYLRENFPDHVGLNKKNADVISEKIVKELADETKKYLVE